MNKFYCLFLFLLCSTCSSNNSDKELLLNKYLIIDREFNQIDTLSRELIDFQLIDSVYKVSYNTHFSKAEDTFNEKYAFQINERELIGKGTYPVVVTLLGTKRISYQNKDYLIYKYFYDELNASDEEMLYFFEPTFGLIIDKLAWQGKYNRLIDTGNKNDKEIIFYLGEMILFDSEFFHYHNVQDK